MSFRSLDKLLSALENQAQFKELQQFQRILDCWPEAVGAAVASHSKPVGIARNVLWVATSSSAWSQTLTLERSRILKKLNALLPDPPIDIRFSPAQWRDAATAYTLDRENTFRGSLPKTSLPAVKREPAKDPQTAFARWAQTLQKRSQLPLCPRCQCHTPAAEIERWGICAFCNSKPER
jgi:predicted nucleic acid-binding Zn ribbon protein